MRRALTWIAMLAGLPLLCWLGVNRFMIEIRTQDYGGQADIVLLQGLESNLLLDPSWRFSFLPFVVSRIDIGPPFGLRLQIWDKSREFVRLTLSEIHVAQDRSPPQRLLQGWSWPLEPYVHHVSAQGVGLISTPMMQLSTTIPDVVTSDGDLRLTLIGSLTLRDGSSLPLRSTHRFVADENIGSMSWAELIEGFLSGS